MFWRRSIRLEAGLYAKAKARAAEMGYASVEEFVTHLLERQLQRPADCDKADEDRLLRRLKGLGYLE